MADTNRVLNSGRPLTSSKPGRSFGSFIRRSADLVHQQGPLRFIELSILSLIEPIRSARLRHAVAADAKRLSVKLNATGKRGLFIDCGSNVGQGFQFFSQHYPLDQYDYILIEPNPNCVPYLNKLILGGDTPIEIVAKAASTSSGCTQLFGPPAEHRDPTHEGFSIVADHNTALYQAEELGDGLIETFSLSDLILSKHEPYDVIAVKMDVEGAEYDILHDMIAKGAHRKVDAIYVEFHSQYMAGSRRTEKRLAEQRIEQTFETAQIIFRRWI